jgi:hypothetical protein
MPISARPGAMQSQTNTLSVLFLLSLLIFLIMFNYLSYSNIFKKYHIFSIICFINKENSNTTYNFAYLNKYFE